MEDTKQNTLDFCTGVHNIFRTPTHMLNSQYNTYVLSCRDCDYWELRDAQSNERIEGSTQ